MVVVDGTLDQINEQAGRIAAKPQQSIRHPAHQPPVKHQAASQVVRLLADTAPRVTPPVSPLDLSELEVFIDEQSLQTRKIRLRLIHFLHEP